MTTTLPPPQLEPAQLERLAIDTIRTLSINAVAHARSGHPGAPIGGRVVQERLGGRAVPRPDAGHGTIA
jgi:hypothetical protein